MTQTRRPPERAARQTVVRAAQAMSRSGLSPGRSGNVSMRVAGGMLITPSGLAYDDTSPDDVVFVAADGTVSAGQRTPSTEWHFHLAAYAARPDRGAVVHSHSLNATVLACCHRSIPAFHYMVAVAGGDDIPCVPYATFGTEELARYVVDGLRHRDACLMANHGQVAIGADLDAALELAQEVETLATLYVKVLTLGEPHILSAQEMMLMIEKFKSYRQRAATTPETAPQKKAKPAAPRTVIASRKLK
jgi:L-fuculose-phosphate aldolase